MSTKEADVVLPVPTNTLRHEFECVRLGPFSMDTTPTWGGGITIKDGNNPTRVHADRKWVLESARILVETLPSGTMTIQWFWAAEGQTMAQAVTAAQYVTDAKSVAALTLNTWSDFTVRAAQNVILAGERLFFVVVSDADGSGSGTGDDVTCEGIHMELRRRTLIH
jgi:hypothetical protein